MGVSFFFLPIFLDFFFLSYYWFVLLNPSESGDSLFDFHFTSVLCSKLHLLDLMD